MDISKILFLDVETVSQNKELDIDSKEYELFSWKMRNKDTSEELPSDELLKMYKLKAALHPAFSKIACITVGFVHDNKIRLKSFSGEEKDVIEDFIEMSGKFSLLGVFNAPFDIPIIRKRAAVHGIVANTPFHNKFSDIGEKPWTIGKKIADVMDLWKGIGFYVESLDELCYMLGIESPKDGLKGSQVSEAYYNGRIKDICVYNQADVRATIQCFLKLHNLDSDLEVLVTKGNVGYASALDRAAITKTIDLEKIESEISNTKLTKKEKEVAESLTETVKAYVEK